MRQCIGSASVLGLAMVVALALLPGKAQACGADPPLTGIPIDGATGVPLNVEPILATITLVGSLSLCEVSSEGDAGILVPSELRRLDANFSRLVPRALLRSQTLYEYRLGTDCTGAAIGAFTTGDSEDLTPPDFAGVTAIVEDRYHAPLVNLCGPGSYNFHRIEMTAPVDAEAGTRNLLLLVYEGPTPDAVELESPSMVLPVWERELTGKLSPDERDDLAVVVTAVDWAGNESAPQVPVMVQRTCGCQGSGAPGLLALPLILIPALRSSRRPGIKRPAG